MTPISQKCLRLVNSTTSRLTLRTIRPMWRCSVQMLRDKSATAKWSSWRSMMKMKSRRQWWSPLQTVMTRLAHALFTKRLWRSTRRYFFAICRTIRPVKFCPRKMLILATSKSAIHVLIALAEWCRLSIANTRKNGCALQARSISSVSLLTMTVANCSLRLRFSRTRG